MRFSFVVALVATILIGTIYWYRTTEYICPAPLSYRLGVIDASFEISEAEAKQHLATAEAVWERDTDRELFVYDEEANFTINFVFDERQSLANSEAESRAELDLQKAENDEILRVVEELQQDYNSLSQAYERRAAAYETELTAYNQRVNKYNDRGGAPSDVYEELEDERVRLNNEAEALSSTAAELNGLAARINELSDRGNQLVNEYNREVEQYNSRYGFSREFTQGDYQGDKINIYKFSDEAELVTVLTHEFGHALGIGHVDESPSVMYYLLEETSDTPVLSAADTAAFVETCGNGDELSHQIRRIIREALAIIN